VARHDAGLLVVTSRIPGKLENLHEQGEKPQRLLKILTGSTDTSKKTARI
jgi:hypothetical protein